MTEIIDGGRRRAWQITLGRKGEDERTAFCFSSPEQQQHRLRESLEIVVPVDLRVVPQRYLTKHLNKAEEVVTADGTCYRKRRWGRTVKKGKRHNRPERIGPEWVSVVMRDRNDSQTREKDRGGDTGETMKNWRRKSGEEDRVAGWLQEDKDRT